MDCHSILHKQSWSPEDETYRLVNPLNLSELTKMSVDVYFLSLSVCQTFSGCSLTVCMMRTSSRRTLSTSGRRAKTLPSSRGKVWPSSPSQPSSPGCGRRRRSLRIIDEGDTPPIQHSRTATLQQNKHSKWVCGQDDMFTAGIVFCGTVLKHAAILSLDINGGSTKYLYNT